MTDIEIARECKSKDIKEVAASLGISEDNLFMYGHSKAKVLCNGDKTNSKLVLVTAMSPTPLGEGKTTVSIGLADALNMKNKSVCLALRQPSMGPVFGMKGGATGGGYSQVIPMEDINLHFTGDFHAITAANNLICAAVDNHIEQGNSLDIHRVTFERCLDVNDRALRNITTKYGSTSFNITAASEIMSILCLANDFDDLRNRLSNIVIGLNSNDEYVYLKDLNIVGSLLVILKEAFNPNLVQTLEGTPAFIHGGPFANIAHGCNSVRATKMALSYSDYVITEAGFGADLGAEKFFDIKCRYSNLKPDCVVLVTTIKALKYHGGVSKENILTRNDELYIKGFNNLVTHYENIKKFTSNVVVCLNKFNTDTNEEIKLLSDFCRNNNIPFSISTAYSDGGVGASDLADVVLEEINSANDFNLLYDVDLSIKDKIEKVAKEIYRADNVLYTDGVLDKIKDIENNNLSNLPICVSKTQYSLSDDAKNIKIGGYSITVSDIKLYNGAGFITVLLGSVLTMPGLPKKPNYEKIDLVNDNIIGLS
ncbi:MAG: formate--tetrahydrofolate ligase [Firmicutes bacterium]|nr:formate--tetrahydrofolate ligase [Bacillota bacterium]